MLSRIEELRYSIPLGYSGNRTKGYSSYTLVLEFDSKDILVII